MAEVVAGELPVNELDGLWVFAPLRREQREFGTAVLARVSGERRRIYTARYVLAIKGKERGKFEATVEEVGSGPLEALAELLQEVRKRLDDEEPPVGIPVETWYPDRGVDEPAGSAVAEAPVAEAPIAEETNDGGAEQG